MLESGSPQPCHPPSSESPRLRPGANAAVSELRAEIDGLGAALLVGSVEGQFPREVASGILALKSSRLKDANNATLEAAPLSPGAPVSAASIGAKATDGNAGDVTLVEFHETNRPGAATAIQSKVVRFGVSAPEDRRLTAKTDARGRRARRRRARRLAKKGGSEGDVVGSFQYGKALLTNYEFVLQRALPSVNVSDLVNVFAGVFLSFIFFLIAPVGLGHGQLHRARRGRGERDVPGFQRDGDARARVRRLRRLSRRRRNGECDGTDRHGRVRPRGRADLPIPGVFLFFVASSPDDVPRRSDLRGGRRGLGRGYLRRRGRDRDEHDLLVRRRAGGPVAYALAAVP